MYKDDINILPDYAMFGENLTLVDLDENDVYFGNQYQLGEAIVEVSEIREPCWKIQRKYGIKHLVKRMSSSGKTGFYMRVLKRRLCAATKIIYYSLKLLNLLHAYLFKI